MRKRLMAILLATAMVLLLLPGAALAAPATSVWFGNTEYTVDAAGTGWALTFGSETVLTLNGYNGPEISADQDLKVILTGTNTITNSGGQNGFGLNSNGNLDISGGGTLTVTAGTGGNDYAIMCFQGNLNISNVTIEATGGSNGAGIVASGLTIDGAHVTASSPGSGIIVDESLTVRNASTVNGSGNAGVRAYDGILVTGGSSLTGTASSAAGVGVSSIFDVITVSGAGSRIRGVNSAANATGAGILSGGAITGDVTEPAGGVVGTQSLDLGWGPQDYFVVLSGAGGAPALAATLMAPGSGGGGGGGGGAGDTFGDTVAADIPQAGDGSMPGLWAVLMLLAGAGLCVVRRKRRA